MFEPHGHQRSRSEIQSPRGGGRISAARQSGRQGRTKSATKAQHARSSSLASRGVGDQPQQSRSRSRSRRGSTASHQGVAFAGDKTLTSGLSIAGEWVKNEVWTIAQVPNGADSLQLLRTNANGMVNGCEFFFLLNMQSRFVDISKYRLLHRLLCLQLSCACIPMISAPTLTSSIFLCHYRAHQMTPFLVLH